MPPKPQWWENAFFGIALDLWRQALSPEQTRADAEFLAQQLRLTPGCAVLDAPCGEGRIALELSARGFHVTGIDISLENITRATGQARQRDLDVAWFQGNMRDLPWRADFDAAFCWGNSFGYFESDEDDVRFVQSLAAALKPGGRLVIQSDVTAEVLFKHDFQPEQSYEFGDLKFYSSNRYDPATSRMHTIDRFVRGDEDVTMKGQQRIYLAGDFVRMIRQSGMELVALYGGLEAEPLTIGGGQFILLAERCGRQ